jgi:integrase
MHQFLDDCRPRGGKSPETVSFDAASWQHRPGPRAWYAIRKEAGLGTTRLHDLRHTCVTLLLDLGVPPHVVRDIVGHSDIEVTMTIYAHVSLDEKRNALRKLGDALG